MSLAPNAKGICSLQVKGEWLELMRTDITSHQPAFLVFCQKDGVPLTLSHSRICLFGAVIQKVRPVLGYYPRG